MAIRQCVLGLIAGALLSTASFGQQTEANKLRQEAMELVHEQRLIEALPLLERAVAASPEDAEVKGWLSYALLVHAQTLSEPAARTQVRVRARGLAIEAVKAGVDKNDLFALVAAIPEDGHQDKFSDKAEVEAAMQAGEKAFAKRDFDTAISAYTRAHLLDPKAYHAALFIGDSYFAKREMGSAGQWFAKAIEINPDIETAYRYWGDALALMSEHNEARSKYIEAIIAEPYNRSSWVGVLQWAQRHQLVVRHPQLDIPVASETKADGNTNVTLNLAATDAKDDSAIWIGYEFSKILWKKNNFQKEFPSEKVYRHTLKEESHALAVVAETVDSQIKNGELKTPNPQLVTLVTLHREGLLDAFVLLARADQGIAKDYDAYRAANRQKLRQYLDQYVIPRKTSSRVN